MRILQIGKFYPIRGGVEKVMYDLMLGLSEAGTACDMLCATTEDYPAGTLRINERARLICVPTKIKAAATMLAPAMISTLRAIAKDYDLLHIHHPDPMACLALFLSGYKGKVVLHWHSDILKQKTLLKLYKPLQDWLIKRADLIVGTTPVYVEQSPFLRKVQHKVGFIPIGVEPVQHRAENARAIRERYAGKKIVFALGRLVEYKGYEFLIKAAAQLGESYQVLIGGKGPLKQELEYLIRTVGVQDKVELLGFISDEEVPDYFGACDMLCLSSILKTEAFAIVQIEAMSCGKPVVSTRIPGSGVSWVNAHGESGLTAEVGDARALAEAIERIGGDDGFYQQLADGAKQRYEQYFTRKAMVEQAKLLYRRVWQG